MLQGQSTSFSLSPSTPVTENLLDRILFYTFFIFFGILNCFIFCTWAGCYATLREDRAIYCPAHKEISEFANREKLKTKEAPQASPRLALLEEPDVNWSTIMDTSVLIQKLINGDLDVDSEKLYKQARI
jgi:hypothetical protein